MTIIVLGDSMAFLCISLNNSSVNVLHLIDGELCEIDKYTSKFDTAKQILKQFPEKIAEFNHIYNIENTDKGDIKLRIFLPDDKERFVMYKKYFIAFKSIIHNRHFLRYAINYEPNLLDKKCVDMINDKNVTDDEINAALNNALCEFTEDEYYTFVRRICDQYNNYAEDYADHNVATLDDVYRSYLKKVKEGQIKPIRKIVKPKRKQNLPSAFTLFEHPNFFKKYGNSFSRQKPIFIFGGLVNEVNRGEYIELYNNCKKCFNNPIYYPFNANVSLPLVNEFLKLYDDSIMVIVNGNEHNEDLDLKIKRAAQKNITILILVSDDHFEQLYNKYYGALDTVIIRRYKFGSYESHKMLADIIAGLYINEYKKQAR